MDGAKPGTKKVKCSRCGGTGPDQPADTDAAGNDDEYADMPDVFRNRNDYRNAV